jgi:hypothetical protein
VAKKLIKGPVIRRRIRVQPEPESTGDLMAGLLSRLGGSGRGLEYRVFSAYTEVAGAVLRTRTLPDSFRDGTLFIRVSSAALGHELTLLREDLLSRMNGLLGDGIVRAIRTRVGTVPSPVPERLA